MASILITQEQARHFLLAYQGLRPPYQLEGKAGILSFIRRMGCIQFDPLNIVGHNSDLVLQARLSAFQPGMLQELLYEDRQLLDGWDKNMSIYPVEDWPYFHRLRQDARKNLRRNEELVLGVLPQVRQAMEERGPLSSLELDFDQTVDWWWSPTTLGRAALESMYLWGELVIHHKQRTRRVYDFAHRHLPLELLSTPDPNPDDEQYHDWYVLRRIGSIGLLWSRAGDAWLGMFGIKAPQRQPALARLLEQGQIFEVQVEGIEVPFYIRSLDRPILDQTLGSPNPAPRAAIIAPLDNLIWERRLVKELFGFEYRWEVYKPAAERDYGYYVLPVLYGDRFIARFEPGRDKKDKALVIKNWWWEPGVEPTAELKSALKDCFRRFIRYLGADRLQLDGLSANLEWARELG